MKNAETQGQYSVPEKNHQLHDPGKVLESCNRWLWQTETPAMRSCHVAGGTVIFVFSYFSAAM